MEKLFWCFTCKVLLENSSGHDHDIILLGDDQSKTITALDEIIQFGLDTLKNKEDEIENARKVKGDIDELRKKFMDKINSRIERMIKDVLEAMQDCGNELMGEVNKKVGDMELRAQSIITTSRTHIDIIKAFIEKSAITLPDEAGHLTVSQLKTLHGHYKSVKNLESKPKVRLAPVEVNVNYPHSMQRKILCKELAKNITGSIENPKRDSFLNLDEREGENAENKTQEVSRRSRKMSRDTFKC